MRGGTELTTSIQINANLELTIADNKMHAYLNFYQYEDSFTCTLAELEALLAAHKVTYGLKKTVLADIAAQPHVYKSGLTLVAEGLAPQDGQDGSIRVLKNEDMDSQRPKEQHDGTVDLKETKILNNVVVGERIAELIPATKGIPGTNVLGQSVPGKDGKEARFKLGKNVVVDDSQRCMYAAIDGLIVKTDRDKYNVFPVYEVNGDVDYRTGNIDFVGTVVVRGNVLTGFKIKAAGDIRVYGGVEGAQLEASGSVEVVGGIIASNKGYVHAGQQVKCIFMQEANVTAGTDVIVSQSIMHSQVRAGQQVICNGTKGLIVGGVIQAGDLVQARTVGNSMSTVTSIEVGVLPELRNELNELRNQLRNSMANLEKTEKALRILDPLASAGQLAPDKMAMRVKLNVTKKSLLQEQTDIRERTFEIEKMLEESGVAKIEVYQHIYGGTKIVIGRSVRFVKDVCKRVCFRMIDGEVGMISL